MSAADHVLFGVGAGGSDEYRVTTSLDCMMEIMSALTWDTHLVFEWLLDWIEHMNQVGWWMRHVERRRLQV